MSTIPLEIDGRQVAAEEGETILEAAQRNGIHIPTLCYNKQLKPYGECRLCMVEVTKGNRTRIVASCAYPAEENIVVKTNTEKIAKIRKMIIELLWPSLSALAKDYGVTESRFHSDHTDCNLCGMCVRYCSEVKKLNAVYFKGRGINREIAVVPDLANECIYCRDCFTLCSGGWIVDKCDNAYTSLSK
ncbi:2Fe-2S iron-sulfur cluster-binding protein [bacterium]|nr:2Fe-2S iron-sulfur cluster-binding protein [bacterium]